MDGSTAAVILCAGMGSRIGLPEGENKCAVSIAGTSPIRHTAASLLRRGVSQIFVVVGYAAESVWAALADDMQSERIHFVVNPNYNWHGCNYSLACGVTNTLLRHKRIVIAEGDSLLGEYAIEQLLHMNVPAASLLRDRSYIDYSRSVIAVGDEQGISAYQYDSTHTGIQPSWLGEQEILGESMQLWSFSGQALEQLKNFLNVYKTEAESGKSPFSHSGVHTINALGIPIQPVFAKYPEEWINLNTQEDLRRAERAKWLTK